MTLSLDYLNFGIRILQMWFLNPLCSGIDLVFLVMLHHSLLPQDTFFDHPRPRLMVHPFFVHMMDRFESLMRKASWMQLDGWIVTAGAILYDRDGVLY